MLRSILTAFVTFTVSLPCWALKAGSYRGTNANAWVWNHCAVDIFNGPNDDIHLLSFTDSNHAYNLWGESTLIYPAEGGRLRAIGYLNFAYKDAGGTWIYQSQRQRGTATVEMSMDLSWDGYPVAFSIKHKSLEARSDWGNEIQCENLKPAP